MKHFVLALLVLALAVTGALAQPQPGQQGQQGQGGQQGPGGQRGANINRPSVMVNTPNGLFILRDGVLAKIETKTLKVVGNALELFGPAPARPEGNFRDNRDAFTAYFTEMAQRTGPAIMIPKDDALLIVIGTNFFRVNQVTMAIDVDKDFAGPNAGAAGGNAGGFQQMLGGNTAPTYLMGETTLYLLRGNELIAISIKDGASARTPLPAQMTQQMNFFGGMGGFGGQGGGGRGGQGGQGGGGRGGQGGQGGGGQGGQGGGGNGGGANGGAANGAV